MAPRSAGKPVTDAGRRTFSHSTPPSRRSGADGPITAGPATHLSPFLTDPDPLISRTATSFPNPVRPRVICVTEVSPAHAIYAVTLFFRRSKLGSGAMIGEHIKESFVARIWLEPSDNGGTTWRGHIRHVQGEEEENFQDLMEMREFLGRVSGVTGPALTAQPLKDAAKSEPGTVTNMKQKD